MDRLFRKPINFLQGVVVLLFVLTNSPAQGQIKQEYLSQSQSNQQEGNRELLTGNRRE